METREQELERQLRELHARLGQPTAQTPAPIAPAPMPMAPPMQAPMQPAWNQPAMMPGQPMMPAGSMPFAGQAPQPRGILIGINVPTPEGEATAFLEFGPEACGGNPQALVMQLLQAGWPLKIYRPNNGFNRGGGYGGGGGGFRRRGGGW